MAMQAGLGSLDPSTVTVKGVKIGWTCTEMPDEAVERVRVTGALGGCGLKAVLLPTSLSFAAMLAHVFGFEASAGACCAVPGAGAAGAAAADCCEAA